MILKEFFPYWAEVRGALLDLIELIPDQDLGWSPDPPMLPFSGHVLHIAETDRFWLDHVVLGRPYRDLVLEGEVKGTWVVAPGCETKAAMVRELDAAWETVEELLAWEADRRSERFKAAHWGEDRAASLHWILHHTMDHEIHHRAYIAAYLRMRGIAPASQRMP